MAVVLCSADAGAAQRCEAVAGLRRALGPETRQIVELCQGKVARTEAAEVLSRAADRLSDAPLWQATLLLEVGSTAAPRTSEMLPQLAKLARDIVGPEPRCREVRAAFVEDARRRAARELVGVPLGSELLEPATCAAALGSPEPPGGAATDIRSDGRVFLIVAASPGDRVAAVVWPNVSARGGHGGPYVEELDVGWEFSKVAYFVTSVPRGSEVIVRQQRSNADAPTVFRQRMSESYASLPELGYAPRFCVEVEVLASDGIPLLDGRVLPRAASERGRRTWERYFARSFVPRSEHELVVVSPTTGAVQADVTIVETELRAEGCARRRLDLRKTNVSALIVTLDEACSDQGIVRELVSSYAKGYLRAHGPGRLVDFDAWATALGAVGSLHGSLSAAGSAPVGAGRGRLDSSETLKSAAGELMRQGFREAFVSHLSCSAGGQRPSFTFVVHRLVLSSLQSVEQSDLYGMDESKFGLSTERETVTRLDDLRDAVRAPLARLLEVPYARLVTEAKVKDLHGKPEQLVELWSPRRVRTGLTLELFRFKDAGAAKTYCSDVDERRMLVSVAPEERKPVGETAELVLQRELALTSGSSGLKADGQADRTARRPGGQAVEWVRLPFTYPGTYLVALTLKADGAALPEADRKWMGERSELCVEGADARIRAFGLLSVSPLALGTRTELGTEELSHFALLGGLSFSRPNEVGLSLAAGYASTSHHAATPASWNDLGAAVDYDPRGTLDLGWERRSFVLGAGPEIEVLPFCPGPASWFSKRPSGGCTELSRRFAVVLRSLLMLDAGFLKVGDIPAELTEFRNTNASTATLLDFDVNLALHAGVRVRLERRLDAMLLANFWWTGLDDALVPKRDLVSYDNRWVFGIAGGVGYGL